MADYLKDFDLNQVVSAYKTVNESLDKIAPATQAVAAVLADPYLPEVTCLTLRLNQLHETGTAGPICAKTQVSDANKNKGIGLKYAASGLRFANFARQYPVATGAIALGTVGLIYWLGYSNGKGSK